MADVKQTEAPSGAAELRRVYSLEYNAIKTRDALRVIARSLDGLAERHATAEERRQGLTEDDVSMLYGAVGLLDNVAEECNRVYMGEA